MPGLTTTEDKFQSLVDALSAKLGPCSGIDSDDVDETELQQLMQDYISDESEWKKYFFPASNMAYTRNLVDKGNGKSNLVSILFLQIHYDERLLMHIVDPSLVARPRKSYSRVSSFVRIDKDTQ
jgi:hypothetical protein